MYISAPPLVPDCVACTFQMYVYLLAHDLMCLPNAFLYIVTRSMRQAVFSTFLFHKLARQRCGNAERKIRVAAGAEPCGPSLTLICNLENQFRITVMLNPDL